MKITFYGHACFGVEINGTSLLFDPFISPNPKAAHIKLSEIKADFILISHGHEDHVADAVALARQNDATIISNYEIVSWFAGQGCKKGHPMNIGGKWLFEWGKVKYVNAIHSSVMPDGSYGGNPGGFLIECRDGNQDKTFYFAGDTALTYDMKLLGERYRLDFAMLPVGDNFTMGIHDAITASQFIECEKIIGMHFDTFGFIEIDHEEALNKFQDAGKKLILPEIGQVFEL